MSPDRFEGSATELAAYKAGQIDAKLEQLTKHAAAVNGSIADSARALGELVAIVAEVRTKIRLAGYVAGVFLSAWVSAIAYLIVHG